MADVRDTAAVTTSTQMSGHDDRTGESSGDADDTHEHRHQRHAGLVDEVKRKYFEALGDDITPEPNPKIAKSFDGKKKMAKRFVEYFNVESNNKFLIDFARDEDVIDQVDIIIDHLHRGLRTHFRIPGYIELVGSHVDGSALGRINKIDSFYVMNENFTFTHGQKENTFELYSADGHRHDPSDLITEFASAIEKCMEECPSTTLNGTMRHGGFNTPHFSGVRYNGPAVTILLIPEAKSKDVNPLKDRDSEELEPLSDAFLEHRLNISIHVTLAFKLASDSKIVSRIRSKVNKVQSVVPGKMINKTDVHFIPRPQHDSWCVTTARLEARLLSCLPAESYVKQTYCYTKLINGSIYFPDIQKTEFQDQISKTLPVSKNDQGNRIKDLQKMMRYSHTFLSDSDAKKHNEDSKRDISLNNAALKHMLLREALRSPLLFLETPSHDPFDLALKVFNDIGQLEQFSVPHAFMNDTEISVFSLTKSAILSNERRHLQLQTKQLCMETCKLFGENDNIAVNEELRPLRIELLLVASLCGHKPMMDKLLKFEGIDVNSESSLGMTAMYAASLGGSLDIAKTLLEKGSKLNHIKMLPLHGAALRGHVDFVKWLLDQGIDVNAENHLGLTALYYSCKSGYLEVARQLVTHGADIGRGNSTPLMGAASSGHLDMTQWLIEQGTDACLKDTRGQDALQSVRNKMDQLGDDLAALNLREKLLDVEKMLMITRV